jgi:hypothetical protein
MSSASSIPNQVMCYTFLVWLITVSLCILLFLKTASSVEADVESSGAEIIRTVVLVRQFIVTQILEFSMNCLGRGVSTKKNYGKISENHKQIM